MIYFDSTFESGNLDAVVKIDSYEYDLFMRIDANTKGHNQWFIEITLIQFNFLDFILKFTMLRKIKKLLSISETLQNHQVCFKKE